LENGRQRFSISGILPMNEESKGRLIFLGTIFILLTILFIGFVIHPVIAWTPPASPPPGGNVAEPLNAGATAQGKIGNLGIGTATPTATLDVGGNFKVTSAGVVTGASGNVSMWTNDSTYLTSYSETDPVYSASAASGITSTNITNWGTAYGWGNHGSVGYLTSYSETDPSVSTLTTGKWCTTNGSVITCTSDAPLGSESDPIYTASDASEISVTTPSNGQLLKYNSTSTDWENWTPTYISSYSETDPQVDTTTSGNFCKGTGTAVSCTDSSTYLTSYSETDPQVGTLTNTKWCTTNGSVITCTSDAPLGSESDPQVDAVTSGNFCKGTGTTVSCTDSSTYLTSYSETDPQVGTVTENYVPKANGSNVLGTGTIYDDGKIGIGTNSPNTLLTLANDSWISAKNSAGTASVNMFKINTSDEIEVGGTLNIGTIGLTQDSGAVTLVNMPVSSTPTAGTEESYSFSIDSDSILKVYAEADGTGGIQNKRIGIATASPTAMLDVGGNFKVSSAGAVTGASGNVSMWTNDSGYLTSYSETDPQVGTVTENYVPKANASGVLGTGTIYDDGNIGIGTTGPDGTLHVFTGSAGSTTAANIANDFIVENSDNTGISILTPDANLASLYFGTPSENHGGELIWDYTNTKFALSTNWAGAELAFETAVGVEAMRIDSSGNVGIGTTNPQNKLTITDDLGNDYTSLLSTQQMQLSQLQGGAYFGRVGITENQWGLSNYGNLWSQIQYIQEDIDGVAVSSNAKIQSVVSDTGKIYISSDYGNSYIQIADIGVNFNDIAMSSEGKIQSAIADGGKIYISSDYGNSWTQSQDTSEELIDIAMSSDGKMQAAVDLGGKVYTSSNYGNLWVEKENFWPNSVGAQGVAMSSDGKIQTVVGWSGEIYLSINYGNSWTQTQDTDEHLRSVAMSSDGKIQTTVDAIHGKIYISSDYGNSWTEIKDTSEGLQDIAMSSDGKIQNVTCGISCNFISTDYGHSWTESTDSGNRFKVAMSSDGKRQIAIDALGSGRIYVSYASSYTDGNVGIGITAPGSVLPSDFLSHADSKIFEIRADSGNLGDAGVFIRRADGYAGLDLWASSNDGKVYIDNRESSAVYSDIIFRTKTSGTPVEVLRLKAGGNIGIGTASPGERLDIYTPNTDSAYIRTQRQDTTKSAGIVFSTGTGADWNLYTNSGSLGELIWDNDTSKLMTLTQDGYLGIGPNYTSPNGLLDVNNKLVVTDTQITMNVPLNLATSGDISIASDLQFTNAAASYIKSYAPLYIEAGDPSQNVDLTLRGANSGEVVVDDILRVTNNSYLTSITMSGNIDVQSYDITNVDKLTVNTIDPVHEIDGEEYATYVSFYAGGQKMETSGVIKLEKKKSNYQYVINFDKLEKGSDLWLFWKTIHQDMDSLIVLLTPSFEGRVWYEKVGDSKVIISAESSGEVSYSLTAPREDYKKWPNLISQK